MNIARNACILLLLIGLAVSASGQNLWAKRFKRQATDVASATADVPVENKAAANSLLENAEKVRVQLVDTISKYGKESQVAAKKALETAEEKVKEATNNFSDFTKNFRETSSNQAATAYAKAATQFQNTIDGAKKLFSDITAKANGNGKSLTDAAANAAASVPAANTDKN